MMGAQHRNRCPAQQTFRTSATPDAFLEAFIGRLQAMARSYELLSRENWTESSLAELVRMELAPFGSERLTIEGPDVNLKPKLAPSFGMVLHELATNAGKYGALSSPAGKISVHWSERDGKPCLRFPENRCFLASARRRLIPRETLVVIRAG